MPKKTTAKKTTKATKEVKAVEVEAKKTKPTKSATKTKATKTVKKEKVSPKQKTKPSVKKQEVSLPEIETAAFLEQEEKQTKPSVKKPVRVRKVYVISAIIIILLGFALYNFRSLLVAAVVNGQPISRWSVIQAAEKQSGKQALDTLVRDTLIEQEAQKEHVTVSNQEVDDQMKSVQAKLTAQGQNIDQVLAAQGMTKDDLRNLMRLDKLVQKMVGKQIKVSDKQVSDYISQNKDSLPKNESDAQLRQSVKAQLEQEELQQKVQTWLSNLQTKANILYFVQY